MTKQGLSKFFIIFIFGYLILLVGGIFLYKTNRATYKTHTAKQFEDFRYLSQTFNKSSKNQFASKDGQVQAFWGPAASFVVAYVAPKLWEGLESNAVGFADTQVRSMLTGAVTKMVVGCSLDELNGALDSSTSEADFLASGKCPGISKSPLNNLSPDRLNEITYDQKGQGIVSLYTTSTREIAYIETNAINDSLYAQNIVKQIPIVGEGVSSKIFAANDPMITRYALGESFFNMWKTSLNFAYYLIIIPTVAFGFAIMFRMQINPQTQITLLRAIPKLLIAILLITFSYPIASLMLRLGKVVSDLAIGMVWTFVTNVPSVSYQLGWITILGLFGNILEGGGLIIISVLLIFILIINLFRWLYSLIRSLIQIAFLIAFAPLIILFGAFPGKDAIIVNYFKTLAGEILGYFGMYVLFNVAFMLYIMGLNTLIGSDFLVPLFFSAVSLGVLWKSPAAPKLIKGMLGVTPLFGGGDAGPPKRR